MADWSHVMLATQALVNNATSSDELAEIARAHRSLWTEIAAHPKASDELLTWLARDGDMSVRALVTMRILRRDPADSEFEESDDPSPSVPTPLKPVSHEESAETAESRFQKLQQALQEAMEEVGQ
ncbi:MAG: hypothetical protein LBG99_05140 [Propionibacteriaceae bacterium]|jgi:hypothetical protein|nr:hypothetical protein [Propionibacteriaceae bacterium]